MASNLTLPPSVKLKHLWPIEDQIEYEQAQRKKEKGYIDFILFVDLVTNGKYQWYGKDSYNEKLAAVLQKVADGDIKRLMVFMPPRHGKSELISRLFSAYYLYRHPEKWVGINSYAAELAYTFSRNARDNYTMAGGALKDDAYAVKHWETGSGGGLWAAGVGGPITGKGFHLGIIDDPLKNSEEAASETIRSKQKDWYNSTFYTREEPEGAIVIIQTRWHEDDLSGWLLSQEDEEPENWHIVHYEAIKEDEAPNYPPTCLLEVDSRKTGEALAPLRYGPDKLNKIAKRIGAYFFGALYQQTPKPREGGMFKRSWFNFRDRRMPVQAKRVRYWDKAGTSDGGAFTCGVLIANCEGEYCIEDVIRGQWSAREREDIIKKTADMDGRNVQIWVEQEPGSGGKESAENTIRNLSGFSIRADKVTGSKEVRADPFSAQCEAGNVSLLKADWNSGYIERLTAFPNGKYADDVDASSGAFNKLAQRRVIRARSRI